MGIKINEPWITDRVRIQNGYAYIDHPFCNTERQQADHKREHIGKYDGKDFKVLLMDKEAIFKFIYQMAFRDATMRKAFPHNNDETDDSYWKRKNNAYNVAKPVAKQYIDDLLDGKDAIKPESYMIDIREKANVYGFTFGNAQKLINMLAKYMYLICYHDEQKRHLFKNCDCPMDGKMIEIVRKDYKSCSIPQDFSWSKMDLEKGEIPKEYKNFQDIIKELRKDDSYAIEYDFEKWQQ